MKEAMIKEEQLIMGNDVYDMISRHKEKYMSSIEPPVQNEEER